MVDAHTDTIMILAEPFTTSKPYDFKKQDMTQRVQVLLPTMLEHRLTPPPDEIYSLHRKLSGALLLCTKLGAEFACAPLLDHAWENYKFG
jgi:aarF domain-containing kinase